MRELLALPVVHMVLISVSKVGFFFNQLCISILKKQEYSPWIRNLLKISLHLASSWMYVSGTGICKVFALFTVGFMARFHIKELCSKSLQKKMYVNVYFI